MKTTISRYRLLIYNDELDGGKRRLVEIEVKYFTDADGEVRTVAVSVVSPLILATIEHVDSLNPTSYHTVSRELFNDWEEKRITDRELFQALLSKLQRVEA